MYPGRRSVRIILLSPSLNVTHFVKRSVLEIFIPEICSSVHEHNKHAIVFSVSLPPRRLYSVRSAHSMRTGGRLYPRGVRRAATTSILARTSRAQWSALLYGPAQTFPFRRR